MAARLYLVKQNENNNWDTFDSFVVVASNAEIARQYHPVHDAYGDRYPEGRWGNHHSSWCSHPNKATATYLGDYVGDKTEGYLVCCSFNAG